MMKLLTCLLTCGSAMFVHASPVTWSEVNAEFSSTVNVRRVGKGTVPAFSDVLSDHFNITTHVDSSGPDIAANDTVSRAVAFRDWDWDHILSDLQGLFANQIIGLKQGGVIINYAVSQATQATLDPDPNIPSTGIFAATRLSDGQAVGIYVVYQAKPAGGIEKIISDRPGPASQLPLLEWPPRLTQAEALQLVKKRISGDSIEFAQMTSAKRPQSDQYELVWQYTYKPARFTGVVRRARVFPDKFVQRLTGPSDEITSGNVSTRSALSSNKLALAA